VAAVRENVKNRSLAFEDLLDEICHVFAD